MFFVFPRSETGGVRMISGFSESVRGWFIQLLELVNLFRQYTLYDVPEIHRVWGREKGKCPGRRSPNR